MSVFTANHRRNGVRYAESESIVEFWKLSLSSWLAWVLAVCICIMKNRAKSPKSEGSLCIFSEIVGWGNTWYCCVTSCPTGFPDSSVGKESACNAGDLGLIPGLGRSPGEGKGYPLQYSGLENSMKCIVHGVAKSQTRPSDFQFHLALWPSGEEKLQHAEGRKQFESPGLLEREKQNVVQLLQGRTSCYTFLLRSCYWILKSIWT